MAHRPTELYGGARRRPAVKVTAHGSLCPPHLVHVGRVAPHTHKNAVLYCRRRGGGGAAARSTALPGLPTSQFFCVAANVGGASHRGGGADSSAECPPFFVFLFPGRAAGGRSAPASARGGGVPPAPVAAAARPPRAASAPPIERQDRLRAGPGGARPRSGSDRPGSVAFPVARAAAAAGAPPIQAERPKRRHRFQPVAVARRGSQCRPPGSGWLRRAGGDRRQRMQPNRTPNKMTCSGTDDRTPIRLGVCSGNKPRADGDFVRRDCSPLSWGVRAVART